MSKTKIMSLILLLQLFRYSDRLEKEVTKELVEDALRNRIEQEIEKAVVEIAFEYSAFGNCVYQTNYANKEFLFSSASGRCVCIRHDLKVFSKRLKAREARY